MNIQDWTVVEEMTTKKKFAVECIAEIRKNSTGEVVEYPTIEYIDYGSETPNVFNWEENNFSCDCNRSIFFEGSYNDNECSDGKYSVNLKNAKDGKIYYREFEK
jgi:hypothetical protein